MDMPIRPPSHTISTFYHLLLGELPIVLIILLIVGWASWMWKRFGKEFIKEAGVTPQTGPNRWQIDTTDEDASNKIIGRTILVFGLGIMWIIDGLLQAQPALGTDMLHNIIQPVLQGQPSILTNDFLETGVLMFQSRPLGFDSLTVWIQLLIGIGILFGPKRFFGRFALWSSIVWGIAVWLFGEGLGQLFSGGTWLTGAPGSALFYVFIAFLLLRPVSFWQKGDATKSIAFMFSIQWFIDAILQSVPSAGFWGKGALQGIVLPMAQMQQPRWMAAPLYFFANMLSHGFIVWNILIVAIPLLLSIGWFVSPHNKIVWWTNVIVLTLSWWLCQDFGIIGGAGTDPNTGAPLLLISLSILWLKPANASPAHALKTYFTRERAKHSIGKLTTS